MNAQEFVLILKGNYAREQPNPLEIVDDPTLTQKSHYLTLLQRQLPTDTKTADETQAIAKTDKETAVADNVESTVLRARSMLNLIS